MAALTTVTRLVTTGQRVLSGDDIYGGTSRLLSKVLPKQGINVTNVDMTDLEARAATYLCAWLSLNLTPSLAAAFDTRISFETCY
jgi:cystathionine beta-lyase/cystathionine gamma-synthase